MQDTGAGRGQQGVRSQGQEGVDLEFDPQSDPKVSLSLLCYCFATLPPVLSVQAYVTALCIKCSASLVAIHSGILAPNE